MSKADFDDTSLNSAAGSNHTVVIARRHAAYYRGLNLRSRNPSLIRSKKIYSILSMRNRECSNAQHLDDVPFELLPEMVASIQDHSTYHVGEGLPLQGVKDVKSLSVAYEIMRHWEKVFSLYETLGSMQKK